MLFLDPSSIILRTDSINFYRHGSIIRITEVLQLLLVSFLRSINATITISTAGSRISPNTSVVTILKYEVILPIVNRDYFLNQIIKVLNLYSSLNQFLLNLFLKSSLVVRYQYRIILLYLIDVLLKLDGIFGRRLLLSKILNNPGYRTLFIRRSKHPPYFYNKAV